MRDFVDSTRRLTGFLEHFTTHVGFRSVLFLVLSSSFYSVVTKKRLPSGCPSETNTQIPLFDLVSICALFLTLSGLEKSAAIRPFATKKSRLASEKILLADSLATESCRLADRLATKLFFKADNADAGLNVIAQGAWQSLSVQDARELAVRAPSIVFASKSTPARPRGLDLDAFPELPLSRPSDLSGGGGNIARVVTATLHSTLVIRHQHESFSARVWAEKVPPSVGRD